MGLPPGVHAVVLDIEGTTSPLSFVHDVLFPFAAAHLEQTCARADRDPELAVAVEQLRAEYDRESAQHAGVLPAFANGAPYARYLMEQDRKSTALKALQGLIWRAGYEGGALQSRVFDDVPAALREWHRQGVRLFVFSSGSVLAQRMLFAHTGHGDLTPYFAGYFDTTTGPKREPASYAEIARRCALPPERMLFASDVAEELDAAVAAGMRAVLVRRPGNPPIASSPHRITLGLTELAS